MMTSIIPPPNEFLWCDEHAGIAAWLAKNNLGLEFYGSFLNYCARAVDTMKRANKRLLKRHIPHLNDTLATEPLSGAAVLHEMKFYFNRFYPTGPVLTGAYPLNALRKFHLSFTFIDSNMSISTLPKLSTQSYQKAESC